VRFAIGRYDYVLACHCDACKKRTGGAYGISVRTDSASVTEFTGKTKTFIRVGDSGKSVHYEFCPECGTTIRWQVASMPGSVVFAGGAFDDIGQFKVSGEMYIDFALPWARLGCELARTGEPDDVFRRALMARSASQG
jgi:hypothetical protein